MAMRAIFAITLALAVGGCDGDVAPADLAVADMAAARGEFCGGPTQARCCTTEQAGQPCSAGDSCRVANFCGGYYQCVGAVWMHNGAGCDLATSPPTD